MMLGTEYCRHKKKDVLVRTAIENNVCGVTGLRSKCTTTSLLKGNYTNRNDMWYVARTIFHPND